MEKNATDTEKLIKKLEAVGREEVKLDTETALAILENEALPIETLLRIAEEPRRRHFQNRVQFHILNNIKNGHCEEDCGYCVQRRDTDAEIPKYSTKSEEEILAEAKEASETGAFRYCLVASGKSPTSALIERVLPVIRKIKEQYGMEVCLSAGMIKEPALARKLREAGLDRYNHNLNTSESYYKEVCTTHDYADRIKTLELISAEGMSLCSGVIVGMGETPADLVKTATDLSRYNAASIPINFFIPIPGHKIKILHPLTMDYCFRIISLFRLLFPSTEIRIAAGREIYFKERQAEALRVANSLFVSGYLNVKGSNAEDTLEMVLSGGFVPDTDNNFFSHQIEGRIGERKKMENGSFSAPQMKDIEDLRPVATAKNLKKAGNN